MKKIIDFAVITILGMLFIIACVNTKQVSEQNSQETTTTTQTEESPEWVKKLPQSATAKQLFVVAGIGNTTAYISMHEKDESGNWQQLMSTPGYIGKNGLYKTKEGDAKTPVGTYKFNYAFGIAPDPGCKIPYQQVGEDDYWSGDETYNYNKMVKLSDYPQLNMEDSEHIIDYTYQYEYALNINYNEEGKPGLGSAIFLHCFGPQKPYTGGCVSIPREQMVKVMKEITPDCIVIINTLEQIAPELYTEWKL